VLVDWSCRESLHVLDYLGHQTVDRDDYEIVWIENYRRRAAELVRRVEAAEAGGRPPDVDLHVALGLPGDVVCHKHLLYNVGLLLARGRVVCICDSDAMVGEHFVESIVSHFRRDPQTVLHLDQVRNDRRVHYPFDYPSAADVVGHGCANWVDGRPRGLIDPTDALHARNYGACFCALRADLVAIGGADMHPDYLGHVCGPYEMTFRLVNAGRREVWHPLEWIYHVWHPGQAGEGNYCGPHDGFHLSTTALAARSTGRVAPLVEHPAVSARRRGAAPLAPQWLAEIVPDEWLKLWLRRELPTIRRKMRLGGRDIVVHERHGAQPRGAKGRGANPLPPFGRRLGAWARLRLVPVALRMLFSQLAVRNHARALSPPLAGQRAAASVLRRLRSIVSFARRAAAFNRHLLRRAWLCLNAARVTGRKEVVLYGGGDAARALVTLSRLASIRVVAIVPFGPRQNCRRLGPPRWDEGRLADWRGTVLVAAWVNSEARLRRLGELGIERGRVIVME
jgi:hypothetical protein